MAEGCEVSDPMFDVTERVVVVTGGLGTLGEQFTMALSSRGARVAVLDVQGAGGAIREPGGRVRYLRADVTRRADLEAALEVIEREWGPPYGLINNAAIDSPPNASAEENGAFERYSEATFDRVMAVNVKGVVMCCQVFGGRMAEAGRGSVINIASIYGMVSPDQRIYHYRRRSGAPFVKPVAYSVSKSALYNLTRYLATYWAPRGVRVNTLTLAGVEAGQDSEFVQGYVARIPVGRMARIDEYNGAVVFLCSDASAYMTGANLVMDGGWTAW
jgi:NAD(P)-dependent dehydrogenase (short-subunit alcohol dehydrogenase family)